MTISLRKTPKNSMPNTWRTRLAKYLMKPYVDNQIFVSRSPLAHISHLNINVYKAVGGFVIEYNNRDDAIGEIHPAVLHLITDDQDLGKSIAHIITLEILRA